MKHLMFAALGAAVLIAGPALAGDPRGGGHGGAGHPGGPPPPPSGCCHGGGGSAGHGGGNYNVNVNVNSQASASAYSGSYINARGYDFGGGGYRGGGGVVYVGGGYGGDYGGYSYGGPTYSDQLQAGCGSPPSAPFGYAVRGFGRDYRGAPPVYADHGCRTGGGGGAPSCHDPCGGGYGGGYVSGSYSGGTRQEYEIIYVERDGTTASPDRGGRYGYGPTHDDRGQGQGGGYSGCGCGHGTQAPQSGSDPRYGEPQYRDPQYPPRQDYRQEPGERG